jgi:hypothetical protein
MADFGLLRDPAYEGTVAIPGEAASTGAVWPRQLNLSEEVEHRLSLWLHEEIHNARAEKQPLIDDWKKWQEQYWAKPKSEVKNWPFPKAANIVIPLTATAVEAVHARLLNTLFTAEPFFSIRPRSAEWIEPAPKVEAWFQTEIENPNSINMFRFSSESLMELCKLGTCVGKSGYDRVVMKSLRSYEGGHEEDVWVERRNGAVLDYLPIANFLIRAADWDPQSAAWVGEEHRFTWGELKRMALAGRIDPDKLEEIRTHWTSSRSETAGDPGEYDRKIDELSKTEPIWHDEFKLQEIWCRFDVDGDGIDEEIVLDFHWKTMTLLSVRYNWYSDLHRPYRGCPYVPVEGRFWGIGIGKQNEQFQEEITTMHRQRLDNATLANMGMVAVKKNTDYGPDEPIFPGKMWMLDDPSKDITPFKLSEVYPSSFSNESVTLNYSEKRTGVNDMILGQESGGTPGTATGDLARLAEGNKRFDAVLKNVRRWLSQLGTDLLANYQQFGDQDRHWVILGEDGQWVEQVLSLPSQLVRDGAIVEVTATDSITNREVNQQHMLGLMQMLERYYQGQLQLASMLDPQLAAQVAQMAMIASTEATKRLLETFDIPDAEKLLLGGGNGPGQASPSGEAGPGAVGGLPQGADALGLGGLPSGVGPGQAGGGAQGAALLGP